MDYTVICIEFVNSTFRPTGFLPFIYSTYMYAHFKEMLYKYEMSNKMSHGRMYLCVWYAL